MLFFFSSVGLLLPLRWIKSCEWGGGNGSVTADLHLVKGPDDSWEQVRNC